MNKSINAIWSILHGQFWNKMLKWKNIINYVQLFKTTKVLFCVSLTLSLKAVVLTFKIFFPFFIFLLPGWKSSISVIKSSTRLPQENPYIIRADKIAFNKDTGIKFSLLGISVVFQYTTFFVFFQLFVGLYSQWGDLSSKGALNFEVYWGVLDSSHALLLHFWESV